MLSVKVVTTALEVPTLFNATMDTQHSLGTRSGLASATTPGVGHHCNVQVRIIKNIVVLYECSKYSQLLNGLHQDWVSSLLGS